MKILLDNNLEFLYQWDLDRYICLEDIKLSEKLKVNFTNKKIDKAYIQEPKLVNGLLICKIPNLLLQDDKDLTIYIVENDKVIFSKTFKVIGRNKPENYVYTDEEQKFYERMEENLLSEIDKKGDSLEYRDNVLNLLSGNKTLSSVKITSEDMSVEVMLELLDDSDIVKIVGSNNGIFVDNDNNYFVY